MGSAIVTIGIFSFLGAFADFMLGKAGEVALKKRLESFWLRLSYVRWRNFGVEEALLASDIMQGLFGNMLSLRRLKITIALSVMLVIIRLITPNPNEITPLEIASISSITLHLIIEFNVSISVTMYITKLAPRWLSENIIINFLTFIFLIIIQYFLLIFGASIAGLSMWIFSTGLLEIIPRWLSLPVPWHGSPTWQDFFTEATMLYDAGNAKLGSPLYHVNRLYNDVRELRWGDDDYWVLIGAIPNLIGLFRLCLCALFMFSFALSPLKTPLMSLFARIIESDKPIFTLVSGGLAALFQAAQQVFGLIATTGAPPHA